MANSTLCACDQTRKSRVCEKIQHVDPSQTQFDVFAESLAHIAESGIWLNPYSGIPGVPGLPAIEVLLLDRNSVVIDCLPELPENGLDDGDARVVSALFLPSSSISDAQIRVGDQITICNLETKMEWQPDQTGTHAGARECQCLQDESKSKDSVERAGQVQAAIQNMQEAEEKAAADASNAPSKKSFRDRLISWMKGENVQRRRGLRNQYPKLVAYYWTGASPKAFRIGDISPTGFYLITEDRWVLGTQILMTLQREEGDAEDHNNSITVPSKVIRCGADGVGFEFISSAAVDPGSAQVVPSNRHSRERLTHFLQRAIRETREANRLVTH